MNWTKNHKALFSVTVLLVLLILIIVSYPKISVFFISKTTAIDTAIPACGNPTVDQQSFDTQAYIDIYGNAPTAGFRSGLENELSPVWIVHVNGYWALTGGSGLEPVTITTYQECTVIINALTSNVILADFPTLE